MTDVILTLTVECQHPSKRRFEIQTVPSDEISHTLVYFRICDGCVAIAERAGFDFLPAKEFVSPRDTGPGGTDD